MNCSRSGAICLASFSLEPVLKIHAHLECQLRLAGLEEAFLGSVMFEQNGSDVTHQDELLSLVLDTLNRVNHTNVLAHLE